jgi:hypothetical protein
MSHDINHRRLLRNAAMALNAAELARTGYTPQRKPVVPPI